MRPSRHQNYGSDASVNITSLPGSTNQVLYSSHARTLPLEGNLEPTVGYCLSARDQKPRVCSLKHKTAINPQLAGCRGLLKALYTVVSITDAVSMPPSSSVGAKRVILVIQVDDASASSEVLQKYQTTCYDTLNGTVDHRKLVHSSCLRGPIPAGDAPLVAKTIPSYSPRVRPPPWPPPLSGFIWEPRLRFRLTGLNKIH